jgi:hypothetical protein
MPIGSEAMRGRSPEPSRAKPCRAKPCRAGADPIQCAPSFSVSVLVLPFVSAERVETIRKSFVRSPHKSVRPYGMAYEIA